MYEHYSLAELGEISKRYEEEFGDIEKAGGFDPKAAAARALRNQLRGSGKTVRFKNRRDRPRIDERIGSRVERTLEQIQGLANTGKETAANVGQTAERVATTGKEAAAHIAPAVEAAAKPVEATAAPIAAGGKALRNIGLGSGAVLAGGGIGFGAMVRPRKEKIVIEPGRGVQMRKFSDKKQLSRG